AAHSSPIDPRSLHGALPIYALVERGNLRCECFSRRIFGLEQYQLFRIFGLNLCAFFAKAIKCSIAKGYLVPSSPASFTFSGNSRSEEHTSELQSRENLVCRL